MDRIDTEAFRHNSESLATEGPQINFNPIFICPTKVFQVDGDFPPGRQGQGDDFF
jgi:hypothetical protein